MSIERLFKDYNIDYVTEGNKHCSSGWVNIHCPFCSGSQNYHLGISEDMNGGHCWRCGGHSISKILIKILNIDPSEVPEILTRYKGGGRKRVKEPRIAINPLKLPEHHEIDKYGKQYLQKRGYDVDKLKKDWGISQTTPLSILDGIKYNHRILIPIYWNGEIVSFQTRDITDKHPLKYMACPMKREKIHHKNIVYGKQEYASRLNRIIVVEGVFDVWRFGFCAFATLGTSFKKEQVIALSKLSDDFVIIFDGEKEAQKKAKELSIKLKTLGKKVHIEKIKGDPGEMKQKDANDLVKTIIK